MNISDLSVEGLSQLEARLTADLEMVKRMKVLVAEYQKRDRMGLGAQAALSQAEAWVAPGGPASAAGPASHSGPLPQEQSQPNEDEIFLEALARMPAAGFVLEDLSHAAYSPQRHFGKDTIKGWVKRMVRRGAIRVVERRTGRVGSIYASNLPQSSGSES